MTDVKELNELSCFYGQCYKLSAPLHNGQTNPFVLGNIYFNLFSR